LVLADLFEQRSADVCDSLLRGRSRYRLGFRQRTEALELRERVEVVIEPSGVTTGSFQP
jgi:hypothetical protein